MSGPLYCRTVPSKTTVLVSLTPLDLVYSTSLLRSVGPDSTSLTDDREGTPPRPHSPRGGQDRGPQTDVKRFHVEKDCWVSTDVGECELTPTDDTPASVVDGTLVPLAARILEDIHGPPAGLRPVPKTGTFLVRNRTGNRTHTGGRGVGLVPVISPGLWEQNPLGS